MVAQARNKLFTPVQIGAITLKHRVVMPPLSRLRAEWPSGVPSDLMLEYYSQRGSDGGLIFTEATAVAASGRGYRGAPGIYSDEQVAGWKRITGAVHAKGGYMFAQLWHAGRTTHVAVTDEAPVTASVDPAYWADPEMLVVTPDGFSQPSPHRALETAEIAGIIEQYRAAALNAKKAGFDGVELMAANGHLIDQFLQDNSNKRTDRYGGTIENRARLLCEAVEALVAVWGADRVGVRIAPSGTFNGMADSNPRALFRDVASGSRIRFALADHGSIKRPKKARQRIDRLADATADKGELDVLPRDFPMRAKPQECRDLAEQGGAAREPRRRRTIERAPGPRHEKLHLSGAKCVRLCQSRSCLALGTDAAQACGHRTNDR